MMTRIDFRRRLFSVQGTLWAVLALLPSLGAAQPAPADWPAPAQLEPAGLDYDAPEPREETLSNGVTVYLMEDRTLPLVRGVAYVAAPSLYDPPGKTGLAAMTAALLREGGAAGRSPAEIDVRLEQLAGSVEASASAVLASVGFDSLSDTLDEVLPLWRDILTSPEFDPDRLEVLRERQLEAIRRLRDDPTQLAIREFLFRVAEGHPSGAYPTGETIASVTRDDLLGFHSSHYGPANTVIAVSGDFDADRMLATLEELFGSWQVDVAPPPQIPQFDPEPKPRLYLAPRQIGQSIVIVGHPAVLAYSAEYNDLDVANHILGGGGFTSRLFEQIRTRRGLAYSTASVLTQGFEQPGVVLAYSISPAQATAQVLELILAEMERIRAEPVSENELELARETILNQSLFRFTSPAAITERTARVRLLGLEPDYFDRYLENLEEVTAADIQRVAEDELHPERAVIMIVGDPTQFERPLEEFGEVVTIDLE
jgi:zinc protease